MARHRDLSQIFNALPPREKTDPPKPTPAATSSSEPAPPVDEVQAPRAASKPKTPSRKLHSVPAGEKPKPAAKPLRETAPTSLYLPAEQAARWRARARETGQTLAQVLAAATQAVTTEQVSKALDRPGWDRDTGGMPVWQEPAKTQPSINVQVRLAALQLQWLDQQVAATGANSRSELVAALLTLHFES